MPLNKEHLEYPKRKYGMDHNFYDWEMLHAKKLSLWPNEKKLALWINVCVQHFPLNMKGIPFKAPGALTMPYPDLRHYTLRDYGNRVGIYRLFELFQQLQIKASYSLNGCITEIYPDLVKHISSQTNEILAHGWDMDTIHYNGLSIEEEIDIIKKTKDKLQSATGKEIIGWISPARNQSENTPSLLIQNGFKYMCDWVNDDMPYNFKTENGQIVSIPLTYEYEDVFILQNNLHTEKSYSEQLKDAFDFLIKETEQYGKRILSLNLHPWMIGQPHRIGYLDKALQHILSDNNVWVCTAKDILENYN